MSASAINQSTLDAANTTFVDMFSEIWAKADQGAWSQFTQIIPNDAKLTELDAMVDLGAVREWVGSKEYGIARAYKLAVRFRKWEKTMKVDRPDLAYDKSGTLKARIKQFMTEQAGFLDKIVTDSLVSVSGTGPTGYDGVVLFSTAHPHGPSGNQSNKTTSALSFATFDTAQVAMRSLLKENGEPFRIVPKTLMVGPKLFKLASEITKSKDRLAGVSSATLEGGTTVAAATITNIYGGGQYNLIVNDRLVGTQDDYWYLFAGPFMGLVEQRAPEPVILDAMDGEQRFMKDAFLYSIEADVSPCAYAWQNVYAGIL